MGGHYANAGAWNMGRRTPRANKTQRSTAAKKSMSILMYLWYSTFMDTLNSPLRTVDTRSLLLPYTIALVAAMLLVQTVIALTGGEITVLSGVLTALVAIGIAAWLWRNHRKLSQIRFGMAIAHAIAFATVTTSFNLHAVMGTIALGSGAKGFEAAALNLLATPWFGATLMMSAAWGLGLTVHLIGAVLGRGWQD